MALERVYGMAELAAMIGWDRRRLVRHLQNMNEQHGGTLLKNVGRPGKRPRWTTTLSALRSASPQWFRDDEAIENRLQSLQDQQEHTADVLHAATNQIALLSKGMRELKTRADLLESNLRSVLSA